MRQVFVFSVLVCCVLSLGCFDQRVTSDDVQRKQQEVLLMEATSQVGMPAIKNFRERKILKDILELRDQSGLVTYTYLENQINHIIPGQTAKGGKLTFLGETIGYGIPYATQYTNPQKIEFKINPVGPNTPNVLAQADPNGLFSPSSADGTWVLMKNPHGSDVKPVYVECRVVCSPFAFDLDK